MRLVVFHYHDRPGGVREVIGRGLPLLVARLGSVEEVVWVMGGLTDAEWFRKLGESLNGLPLRLAVHADFGYRSGETGGIGTEARRILRDVLSGKEVLVWAHNLSVGRNIALLKELPARCTEAGVRLWLHHHDWWWDGRWDRWTDWRNSGIDSLEEALEWSVPTGPGIRHWCVNQADLPWLQGRAGTSAQWVGNPLADLNRPAGLEVREAAAWLKNHAHGHPVWLAPVRALRRKNLAEALLIMRRADPDAWLVTTGGPSSQTEEPAWKMFCQAAARHGWPVAPGVLAETHGFHPRVAALMAAADVVVMSSLQEGFGLPYLESAALGKPLLARALPEVSANLRQMGCTLTGTYDSVPVGAGEFEPRNERLRKSERWGRLTQNLPVELQEMDSVLDQPAAFDFGQLTLDAQLEVLQSNTYARPVPALPEVPLWPPDSRVDSWANRFFQEDLEVPLTDFPLLPEVRRRFDFWRTHPLLWS